MAGIHLERERFCCSVCSNLLNNPVTVPCGHCFCMSCVNYHLDQEDHVGIYSCPQCREIFVQRPLLVKNTMVAIPFVQAPVEVRQKFKAVKSCLQCLVSYCGKHLQPHNEVARFRMHKLVEATADLEESICPQHQEVMKMFCRTDQRCICYLCSKDGHKGHDKISIEAESCFQQEEEAINQFADNALINTEKVFTELIYTIEKKLSHIKESLQSRQNSEMATPEFKRQNFSPTGASPEINGETFFLSRIPPKRHSRNFSAVSANASFQSPQLAAPIATPRRLRRELSQPENDDFGQNGFIRINKNFDQNSNHLVRSVSQFSLNNLEIVKPSPEELLARASSKVKLNNFQTRANLLKYAQQVSFDPHTANPHLAITNEKRQVVFVGEELAYPYNPERFAYSWQVLSKESLSGRCYLEVERSGKGVMVALCYKSISRAGTFSECMFGQNNKSWALDCFKNSCEFKHNNVKTPIPGIWSSRVGVYLDHRAGVLSFYSVSETMTLLHRVQTSFTEPLHVGLWISSKMTWISTGDF
uniref:Tripartite motif-containing protein 47-like n=1 Tax=Kryptolebias marmoratus TaxID=37003 RepID=A0A3Q3BIH2_KRYMA